MKAEAAMIEERPRGLGRGLSALLGEESEPQQQQPANTRPRTLPVAFLKPSKFQPRRNFAEDELKDLASSIREKGVLQPILVRPTAQADHYEIVAGERRWRAAQMAQLHEVPVTVRELSDVETLELAIIENVQRADLNAMEEATAYQELVEKFDYTQDQLSKIIGKSRSHIANTVRLLKLPEKVQVFVREGKLSAGHARTLIGAANAEARALEIIKGDLNVRQAEQQKAKPPKASKKAKKPTFKDADTKALEQSVSNILGMEVQIHHQGEKGSVEIRYLSLEQLDEIMRRLSTYIEID
jgi:ParB family chromosome partitioning protein